jgi:NADH-quinone oxidoreductase subunit C
MSTLDVAAAVTDAVGGGAVVSESFGGLTVDVPREAWRAAASAVRDDPRSAADFFDWLSAYDDRDAGLALVVRAWSTRHRHAALLRCRLPRDDARVDSLTSIWPGAAWHERETFEMFGVDFVGHPHLAPLLLPEGFEGNPLRKDFVLAARVAKDWPGEKQPGESDLDLEREAPGRRRRRVRPPGVPPPDAWGPR